MKKAMIDYMRNGANDQERFPAASLPTLVGEDKAGVIDTPVDICYNIDMEYQRDEHRVHLILYHIVFCPKRRKPVLVGSVAKDVERLIRLKCEEQGWEVVALEIMPDHVHLFVRAWPTTSAAEVVKQVKGITSHELRGKYPHLLKLPSLWTRSYFASTAGNVSQEAIRRYIDSQRGK